MVESHHMFFVEITADQGTVPLAIRLLRTVSWSSPALVPMEAEIH